MLRGRLDDSSIRQSLDEIHDNGSGFGLLAIQERLEWLKGTFRIDSQSGHGTCAVLVAPVSLSSPAKPEPQDTTVTIQADRDASLTVGPATPQIDGKIRVLLADEHVVMRHGLSGLLQRLPDMEVVGKSADGQEAVDLASAAWRVRPAAWPLLDSRNPVSNSTCTPRALAMIVAVSTARDRSLLTNRTGCPCSIAFKRRAVLHACWTPRLVRCVSDQPPVRSPTC